MGFGLIIVAGFVTTLAFIALVYYFLFSAKPE